MLLQNFLTCVPFSIWDQHFYVRHNSGYSCSIFLCFFFYDENTSVFSFLLSNWSWNPSCFSVCETLPFQELKCINDGVKPNEYFILSLSDTLNEYLVVSTVPFRKFILKFTFDNVKIDFIMFFLENNKNWQKSFLTQVISLMSISFEFANFAN